MGIFILSTYDCNVKENNQNYGIESFVNFSAANVSATVTFVIWSSNLPLGCLSKFFGFW